MRMVDLIHKKRDGHRLTRAEINFLIKGFTNGDIPDYQMSAWAMAVYFQGMTGEETAYLTQAMAESGEQVDLSSIKGKKVDKHSTGGVGDTTTIVLAPLVAAAGVPVAKMSGRGLGHTGGTIDKLESIHGFQIELSQQEFVNNVNRFKISVIGQSANLTPADKQLYALRDVTATVESVPLIASSIMSKKIASGADAIVLDVKTGNGAFMKSRKDAEKLARAMVEIGDKVGRKTTAVISDMNQPLGFAIGNALEVKEAIETLKGMGPSDLTELCLVLGTQMLLLSGLYNDENIARQRLEELIRTGEALNRFKQFVEGHGGNPNVIDRPELLPESRYQIDVVSEQDGFVTEMDTESLGIAAMRLGAGREIKDSPIDYGAGIILRKKINDSVKKGDTLAILYSNHQKILDEISQFVKKSIKINQIRKNNKELIYKVINNA